MKEAEERTLGDGVISLIGDNKALLLLDNLEQIVSAAPDIARLVAACPRLRIVITSRTLLRIAAEREFPLAPLDGVADVARNRCIPLGMPQRDHAGLPGVLEALPGIFADRLEHPEPVASAIHLHERLVDERLQNRAAAITEAIWAHRERHYYLSIPVLLAQADGITYDTINRGMFRADTGRYVRNAVTDLAAPGLTRLAAQMLAPLEAGTSLSATTTSRDLKRAADPKYGPLNRHGVLHGIDLKYGTRVNSCRALVSLGYACWLPDLLR